MVRSLSLSLRCCSPAGPDPTNPAVCSNVQEGQTVGCGLWVVQCIKQYEGIMHQQYYLQFVHFVWLCNLHNVLSALSLAAGGIQSDTASNGTDYCSSEPPEVLLLLSIQPPALH